MGNAGFEGEKRDLVRQLPGNTALRAKLYFSRCPSTTSLASISTEDPNAT